MKKTIFYAFTFAAAIALSSCGNSSGEKGNETNDSTKAPSADAAAPAEQKGKYSLKSGIVTFDSEAMGMKMPVTLYFDDYGKKECELITMEMEMMGTKVETRNATITKDGYVYSVDLVNKTGNKMKQVTSAADFKNMDFSNMSNEFLEKMHMKKEGTETICGKTCDVFSIDNPDMKMKGTVAIWNSIAMKMNVDMGGLVITRNATKFEENAEVPADKFDIPADIKIEEIKL